MWKMATQRSNISDERVSASSHESDLDKYPMDLVSPDEGVSASGSVPDAILASSERMDGLTPTDSNGATPRKLLATSQMNGGDITDSPGIPATSTHASNVPDDIPDDPAPDESEMDKKPAKKCCLPCHRCCIRCCFRCVKPCRTKFNPLPNNASKCSRLRYAFMCPPHGKVAATITLLVAVIYFWAVLWSLTDDKALPGGNFFALIVLLICCVLGGLLVKKIKLPALLGKYIYIIVVIN